MGSYISIFANYEIITFTRPAFLFKLDHDDGTIKINYTTRLENHSGAKYKTFTLTFLISNRIIFLLDQFQPHQPPVILTTRMLVSNI